MTEGVLLYVDGDDEGGRIRVMRAVRADSPEPLRAFAESLRALSRKPGVVPYVGPLREVTDLIGGAADEMAKNRAQAASGGNVQGSETHEKTSEEALHPERSSPSRLATSSRPNDSDPSTAVRGSAEEMALGGNLARWRGGTVVPATEPLSKPCAPGRPFPVSDKTRGFCVRTIEGPVVITELHVPSACGADMFAVGGSLSEPRWIAFAPAGAGLNISGATLLIPEREHLVVGVLSTNEARIARDIRCSTTWTGWGADPPKSQAGSPSGPTLWGTPEPTANDM